MVCDNCGSGDAVVHLTQIVNNQISTYHLCQECAAEKGLEAGPSGADVPLTDFLAQMDEDATVSTSETNGGACGFCGLTLEEFKEVGRLGCPHCWSTFEGHLRNLLRRVHGGTQHVGKVYLPPDPTLTERQERLRSLKRKLERAVDAEDFERAAELRDQIQALDGAP